MMAGASGTSLPLPVFDRPVSLLFVVAPFYRDICDALIAGARAVAEGCGASVEVVEVPGALEVPTAIALAEGRAKYDGYVALGCVIRGETYHYETVCDTSARGIGMLGLQGTCVGNGILTVETIAQAVVRADPKGDDKGGGAAAAALHLVALSRKWSGAKKDIGFRSGAGR